MLSTKRVKSLNKPPYLNNQFVRLLCYRLNHVCETNLLVLAPTNGHSSNHVPVWAGMTARAAVLATVGACIAVAVRANRVASCRARRDHPATTAIDSNIQNQNKKRLCE